HHTGPVRLDALNVAIVGLVRARDARVDDGLPREDDIVRRERRAVVPLHTRAEPEGEPPAVRAEAPRLGEIALRGQVSVVAHEAVVDQRPDRVRRAVTGHGRHQARDVAEQRVDVRVAVGRGGVRHRRTLGGVPVGGAPARESGQQGHADRAPAPDAKRHGVRRYFGCAGAGAAGAAGAGAVAAGGAAAGSRTTELPPRPPSSASENDVIVKTMAMAPVILPSTVGVPIEPNTAWLPAPPKAEPMSAPLPACSSTMAMMARHISTWMTVSAMTIYSPLAARAAFRTMAMNPCATRLAPPTSAPSMSVSAASASTLSAFTLPPYRIRTLCASSLEASSDTSPRR